MNCKTDLTLWAVAHDVAHDHVIIAPVHRLIFAAGSEFCAVLRCPGAMYFSGCRGVRGLHLSRS